MKIRALFFLMATIILSASLSACTNDDNKMQNGYYYSEAAEFDSYGWKEYVSIYVRDNKIVTVEYNARNESGFIKTWDMDYMRSMLAESGTYPSEYSRIYAAELQSAQTPDEVDVITGATDSHIFFKLLSEAAIAQAKSGDKNVAKVEMPIES